MLADLRGLGALQPVGDLQPGFAGLMGRAKADHPNALDKRGALG
jgi:hypothetical protein